MAFAFFRPLVNNIHPIILWIARSNKVVLPKYLQSPQKQANPKPIIIPQNSCTQSCKQALKFYGCKATVHISYQYRQTNFVGEKDILIPLPTAIIPKKSVHCLVSPYGGRSISNKYRVMSEKNKDARSTFHSKRNHTYVCISLENIVNCH